MMTDRVYISHDMNILNHYFFVTAGATNGSVNTVSVRTSTEASRIPMKQLLHAPLRCKLSSRDVDFPRTTWRSVWITGETIFRSKRTL